jgi:hypothetical protein
MHAAWKWAPCRSSAVAGDSGGDSSDDNDSSKLHSLYRVEWMVVVRRTPPHPQCINLRVLLMLKLLPKERHREDGGLT